MRALFFVLLFAGAARADVSLRGGALLGDGGFRDGSGHLSPIAVSGHWIAVIDSWDSCCIDSTLVLHVVTEDGKSVTEIPFACESDGCETPLDRARAERFLRRHHFVVPRDATSLPRDQDDRSHVLPFRVGAKTLDLGDERTSFAVYLPSRKLLIYRWFNSNIPESDEAYHPPYWGVVVRHVD